MGEVYIVLEYTDDIEAQPVSILGVYTHQEQAMKHALTFIDPDTIGSGSEYIDPPAGNILDASVLHNPTRRISIVSSPFVVGILQGQRYTSDNRIDNGTIQREITPYVPTFNNPVYGEMPTIDDDLSPRARRYNERFNQLTIDDPFHPEYDAYGGERSPQNRVDYFGTEFEL